MSIEEVIERAEVTGLGRGLRSCGELSQEALSKTIFYLKRFRKELDEYGGRGFFMLGTEVFRNLKEPGEIITIIEKETGGDFTILTQDEEASLTFSGVISSPLLKGYRRGIVIVDVGGGSTEIIYGDKAGPKDITKIPGLGCLYLLERFDLIPAIRREDIERAEVAVERILKNLGVHEGFSDSPLVLTGGTATTLCAMNLSLDRYLPESVEGMALDLSFIDKIIDASSRLPLHEFSSLKGLSKERAPLIPAGSVILKRVMERFGRRSAIVSTRGLRHGFARSILCRLKDTFQ